MGEEGKHFVTLFWLLVDLVEKVLGAAAGAREVEGAGLVRPLAFDYFSRSSTRFLPVRRSCIRSVLRFFNFPRYFLSSKIDNLD